MERLDREIDRGRERISFKDRAPTIITGVANSK